MSAIIGVMPLYDSEKESIWMLPNYLELIEKNGGIPLILPLTNNRETLDYFLQTCDGFLFTGGQDVVPTLYGEVTQETCGESCVLRDEMETYCLQQAIALDKPILGICRGLQLLNVALGGTLYQDLPTESSSSCQHQMTAPYNRVQHKVTIFPDSLLFTILGKTQVGVNSYHHQGIKRLSPQLKIAATASDGLIEAVYMSNKRFVLAVQWHPEFFEAGTKENQHLLRYFLGRCVRAT
ncbi:MAG TPA: gamma-glutamyl-gamma-aminobutyrate hydrolase family protein [Enterococcus sp.]|nr:gamma-glutamyl-gamma-aminobutyrate hydrolase family protein [Enterococcus sp.]HPR81871.1 gamma-glutamyl-gamma-aminobutyrate hydrolase family protein [Enterococcus sp.]